MAADWQHILRRWTDAGLLEEATAERIRAFEAERTPTQNFRWSVLLALTFGGVMLAAGVLLFVSAHWDEMSPAQRFTLVLAMVALFHAAGAFTRVKFGALSITLHTVGTITLGAGIFLAAQIFNLEEHWPSGILMWLIGAAMAWLLLGDWPQGLLCAMLLPSWLVGEWTVATEHMISEQVSALGLAMFSVVYLAARAREDRLALRRALELLGGVTLIPSLVVLAEVSRHPLFSYGQPTPLRILVTGYAIAVATAMTLAFLLRRQELPAISIAMLWLMSFDAICRTRTGKVDVANLTLYAWCVLGSLGMVAWGVRESRIGRINLGIVGLAITVLAFYFDDLWDKLGRAESLIGLGVLFLYGGWSLERLRRKLVAKIEVSTS